MDCYRDVFLCRDLIEMFDGKCQDVVDVCDYYLRHGEMPENIEQAKEGHRT